MEIRPGSVKQARLEAGLSLGDVARGDISRTAIYFVETGKAKPSMETLQLIADRTGQPVDFFLAGSEGMQFVPAAKLAELERLLATGDNTAVVTAGEAALDTKCDPDTEARIRLVTSLAHLRLAQPVVGRRLASAAREHFERAGDLMMVAEALGNEASAAYLMEDASAVKIARGALATVRSLKPVPKVVESRLLSVLGHTLIASRDWQGAIECYEEAIRAADVVQDLYKLSLMYSGLSVAYQELGQLDQAGRYAQKALAIHQTLNDRLSLARSENNLGILLLRAGDVARAEPHIERALSLFVSSRQRWRPAKPSSSSASPSCCSRNGIWRPPRVWLGRRLRSRSAITRRAPPPMGTIGWRRSRLPATINRRSTSSLPPRWPIPMTAAAASAMRATAPPTQRSWSDVATWPPPTSS